MSQQLTRRALQKILQNHDIGQLSLLEITRLFQSEADLAEYAPDGVCQIDPRTGDRVVYNSARARRPHDNRLEKPAAAEVNNNQPCLICQGKTTGVLDAANLSQGFTFINKNLFPVLYPAATHPEAAGSPANPGQIAARGFHFLQWTSSLHHNDWHNMPQPDRVVVMKRLAALEKKLLVDAAAEAALSPPWGDDAYRSGFVSIIKNYGHLVGGSLAHGHQQIGFSNIMPRRFGDNRRFEMERGETFADYMLRQNPANLVIKDYGPATLLTPYFMRRPFDMLLLLRNTKRRYLHQLSDEEIKAVADGWRDAIRFMRWIMPQWGREIAYNIITNSGPGAGLYFEFLPYTQEMGGFEQLGLFVCQANPQDSAAQIRKFLAESKP